MSDEILSTLGFDASAAISTLKKLGKELENLDGSTGKAAQGLSAFNPISAKTGSALQKLASDADAATKAINSLASAAKSLPSNVNAPTLSSAGAGSAGGAGGGGNSAAQAAQVAATIDQIRSKFNALPKDASDVSKRAYESAITSAAEFATKTNTSIGSVVSTQNNLASSFTGTSNVMADKLSKVSQAFNRAFSDGSRDIRKLTIDYETFVRIITTQAVIKALNAIQNAFSEAVASAAEFQTKVAQIRTISGDLGTQGIADNARKVSDAFNIPLIDSANALYQTFSNQVGTTSQSLEFFAETGKFAKGSVTSMKDSVDLLSGVLNSYGLSAEHTGEVSGKLFKTIELGRVTGTELANRFGRVGVAAKELGIPLDEVLAAFTTITRNGVKTPEAITQVRGAITALTKPTEAMSAALHQLGYASTEDAIQANTLGQLLSKLASTTDGTSAAFAKLFPNVRGLNFAILAGKSQTAQYAADLAEIGKAGKELNDEKANIVINTDAQKAEGELNKLKNFLTVDFGQAILKATANAATFTGGADNIITVVTHMTPALVAGSTVLGLYALKVSFLALKANYTAGALGLLSTAILGVGAAISLGKGIGDYINHLNQAPIDARAKQTEEAIKAQQDAGDKELEIVSKVADAKVKVGLDTLAKLRAQYFQDVDNAQAAYKQLEATTTRSFQKIVSAREGLVGELRKQEENARQSQIDSQDRVADLVAASEDRSFNRKLRNLNDIQKVYALNERAEKTASLAQKQLLSNPGDPKSIQNALKLFDKAASQASEAEEIGKRTGNRVLEYRAAETLNSVTKKQIAAENELTKIQAARQAALEKEKEIQEQAVEELKTQVKIFTENSGDFDKKGNHFSPEELAKRDKARQEAGKKIIESALSQKDLKVMDLLGLTKFASEFSKELTSKPIEVPLSFEKSLTGLRGQLNRAFEGLDAKVPGKKELEGIAGKKLNSPEEIATAAKDAAAQLKTMQEQVNAVGAGSTKIGSLRKEITGIVTESQGRGDFWKTLGNGFGNPATLKSAKENLRALQDDIKAASSNPNLQQKDLDQLMTRYKKLNEDSNAGVHGNGALRTEVDTLGQALLKVKELKDAQDALAKNPAAINMDATIAEMDRLRAALSAMSFDPLETGANALSAAMGSAATSASSLPSSTSSTAANLQAGAAAAERMAAAAARAAAAGRGGGGGGGGGEGDTGEGLWRGGKPRYFADGGPVGPDRIPAWLSRGESVNNASATSKFYSQISAMNAGHAPTAATQVGDTHVSITNNINGAQSPAQTADAVIAASRRAFRRGTSRPF